MKANPATEERGRLCRAVGHSQGRSNTWLVSGPERPLAPHCFIRHRPGWLVHRCSHICSTTRKPPRSQAPDRHKPGLSEGYCRLYVSGRYLRLRCHTNGRPRLWSSAVAPSQYTPGALRSSGMWCWYERRCSWCWWCRYSNTGILSPVESDCGNHGASSKSDWVITSRQENTYLSLCIEECLLFVKFWAQLLVKSNLVHSCPAVVIAAIVVV